MAKGKSTGIIIGWIGTAIAAAVLAGGGVYFWQSSQSAQLKQQVDSLQRQVTELQSGDDSVNRKETTPMEEEDSRRLLDYSPAEGYGANNLFDCMPDEFDANAFNMADPTTTVSYANEDLGFAFEVPWNPAWGTARCRVNPYEESSINESEPILLFGPLIEGEGGLGRQYTLRTIEGRTAAEAIATLQENLGSLLTQGPDQDLVGDFDVVTHAYSGLCDAFTLEVISGGDFNYLLEAGCSEPPFDEEMATYSDFLGGLELL